jgi:hypothetical protein
MTVKYADALLKNGFDHYWIVQTVSRRQSRQTTESELQRNAGSDEAEDEQEVQQPEGQQQGHEPIKFTRAGLQLSDIRLLRKFFDWIGESDEASDGELMGVEPIRYEEPAADQGQAAQELRAYLGGEPL